MTCYTVNCRCEDCWKSLESDLAAARGEIEILKAQLAAADEGLRKGPTMQLWARAEKAQKENDRLREALRQEVESLKQSGMVAIAQRLAALLEDGK